MKWSTMESFDIHLKNSSSNISSTNNFTDGNNNECYVEEKRSFKSSFGIELAVPEWEAIVTVLLLSTIISITVIGNVLVILSVFTYKPLRIVQNFFIISLAVADLTVAILVLPFNITYSILGRWVFGISFCKIWLTCDILCCTSSILNLCSIALDRYWAITDPINYAQKRTMERVLLMIAGVWVLSLIISSPPLLGWNDWPDEFLADTPCQLTSQRGYVIYSSLGSFYIPLIIMTIVYIEIYIATRRRLRNRAKASKINTLAVKQIKNDEVSVEGLDREEQESESSETNHNEHPSVSDTEAHIKMKDRQNKKLSMLETLSKREAGADLSVSDKYQVEFVDKSTKSDDVDLANISSHKNKTLANKKPTTAYQFIEEKQKISLSKERKAARTLGIIMGVFVVCWLPFFLMYVILPFCTSCCPNNKIINFITWLGYINSTLNPVIYTIFNIDYRRAFKQLLGLSR